MERHVNSFYDESSDTRICISANLSMATCFVEELNIILTNINTFNNNNNLKDIEIKTTETVNNKILLYTDPLNRHVDN